MTIKTLFKLFILWQLIIVLMTLLAPSFFQLRDGYLGGGTNQYLINPLLYSRGNFDGFHYTSIGSQGYLHTQYAFFPLYPSIINSLTPIFKNIFLSGTLVSLVSCFVGLVLFIKLLNLDYPHKHVSWIVLTFLLFPTSFFLTFVYTEGLFLLLLMLSFYAARKQWWLVAGIAAALASYTKFMGIFIFPALLVELWIQATSEKWSVNQRIVSLLCVLLAPLGLIKYMLFLKQTTGDALTFYHTLPAFGAFRSEKIILLHQVFWRYGKMLLTINLRDTFYLTLILESITGVIFLITSIYSFAKLRLSYALFNFLAYIVPSLTGSFVSLPRYVLMCFSSFIILGQFLSDHPKTRKIYVLLSLGTYTIYLAMFVRGHWVA